MKQAVAVLMAGGLGTRLWPWSRRERPKQFLPLLGKRSLLGMTADRLVHLISPKDLLVLTNSHLTRLAAEELPALPPDQVIGEPRSCNSAPCVALSAAWVERRRGPETPMVVLSTDHYIGDDEGFRTAVETAIQTARESDCLVTLGIPPTRPETRYGYLECETKHEEIPDGQSTSLIQFREKPDAETAAEFLAGGRHLWNMGNFIWRAATILGEFERQVPELASRAREAVATGSEDALRRFYDELPDDLCASIDYAIMEKAKSIRAVPCRIPWDDIGTWSAVRRLRESETDADGNLSLIRHLALDTKRTLVAGSESEAGIVVTVGVEGLVVIRDGEKVLVVTEAALAQLREVVPALKERGWEGLT